MTPAGRGAATISSSSPGLDVGVATGASFNSLLVLAVLCLTWLAGCAPDAGEVELEIHEAQAAFRHLPGLPGMAVERFEAEAPEAEGPRFAPAAEAAQQEAAAEAIAQAKIERARAEGPCGDCRDRACVLLCLLGESLDEGPVAGGELLVDCLVCGRETGFLPRPTLRLAVDDDKVAHLDWDPVEGAAHYVVQGLRWPTGGEETGELRSYSWQTAQTRFELRLEVGYTYTFTVVAWGEGEDKRRSQPSAPVEVEL